MVDATRLGVAGVMERRSKSAAGFEQTSATAAYAYRIVEIRDVT
jgi:hypothetical protein